MNMQLALQRCAQWFTKILFAQLFLTTFSLPIILWWGLPLSLLTVAGNVLFNPFISLFLFLATLLFFGEILCIPTGPLAWLLEQVTDFWLWCVSKGSSSALVALPKPPLVVLFLITGCSLWIMHTFSKRPGRGIIAFSLFLLLLAGLLPALLVPREMSCEVPYGSRSLLLVAQEGSSCLCDTFGVLRSGAHNSSWVTFTLRPLLVTKLGKVSCDYIIIMRPTHARLTTACAIGKQMGAQLIILPEEACDAALRTAMADASIRCKTVPEKLLRKFAFDHGRQRAQLREIFGK